MKVEEKKAENEAALRVRLLSGGSLNRMSDLEVKPWHSLLVKGKKGKKKKGFRNKNKGPSSPLGRVGVGR